MLECKLENHTIKYLSYGEGHPIIIMHGGGPNDHQYMQSDFEPLFETRKGWRRIYIDLPGHGQTLWPDWVTSHDQILDLLCDFKAEVDYSDFIESLENMSFSIDANHLATITAGSTVIVNHPPRQGAHGGTQLRFSINVDIKK